MVKSAGTARVRALTRPSEEDVKRDIAILKQMCYGGPGTQQAVIKIVSTGQTEMHNFSNACDLVRSGCGTIEGDYCDVCYGRGEYKDQVCWHCEGEGIDPSK